MNVTKKIIFICVLLLLSCQNEHLITQNSVGKYVIGNQLDTNFDKNTFDIQTNSKGFIKSIIVKSSAYKTADLFGVGSPIDSIKIASKTLKENEITISKGKKEIGIFGKGIIYKGVTFIDVDNDKIVDFVWIQKNDRE